MHNLVQKLGQAVFRCFFQHFIILIYLWELCIQSVFNKYFGRLTIGILTFGRVSLGQLLSRK